MSEEPPDLENRQRERVDISTRERFDMLKFGEEIETSFRDRSQTVSPFTVETSGEGVETLQEVHESRSERAQTIDERQNAPTTLSPLEWMENPNRLDFPGVDTIPAGRLQKRSERAADLALEQGAVDRAEKKGSAKTLQGKFSPEGVDTYGVDETVVRVQGTASRPEFTLAHEVGHAFDFDVGKAGMRFGISNNLFTKQDGGPRDKNQELIDEAIGLSKQMRGDFLGQEGYRRSFEELTADVLGSAILQPRATQREAPALFERVQEEFEREGFTPAIPSPMAPDPETSGILDD
jgi:hypothetical protein